MSMIRHNEGRLVVGVDLGGTQIRVLALTDGRPCGRYQGATTDEDGLGNLLRKLWKRQQWSARTVAALVVAAKGIWTEGERRSLAQRLDGLAGRVLVVPDAQAALLGALDGQAGVLILAGTGSIAVGRDDRGRWTRAGGLGPLLGDEGSGFWLGREWLRAISRGEDILPALALLRSRNPVGRIAALAPGVIRRARRGNRDARRIVSVGQAARCPGRGPSPGGARGSARCPGPRHPALGVRRGMHERRPQRRRHDLPRATPGRRSRPRGDRLEDLRVLVTSAGLSRPDHRRELEAANLTGESEGASRIRLNKSVRRPPPPRTSTSPPTERAGLAASLQQY